MNLIISVSVSIWQSLLFFDWYLTFIILFGQILVTIWKDICWAFCQYFMFTQQTPLTQNQKNISWMQKRNKMSSFQFSLSIFQRFLTQFMGHENLKQWIICYLMLQEKVEQITLFYSAAEIYFQELWSISGSFDFQLHLDSKEIT